MARVLLALLSSVVFLFCLACGSTTSSESDSGSFGQTPTKTYYRAQTSSDCSSGGEAVCPLGITVVYPADWQESDGKLTPPGIPGEIARVAISYDYTYPGDRNSRYPAGATDIDTHLRVVRDQLSTKNGAANVRVEIITIRGTKAVRASYQQSDSSGSVRQITEVTFVRPHTMTNYTNQGQTVLIIPRVSFSATADMHTQYMPTVEKILGSITFN